MTQKISDLDLIKQLCMLPEQELWKQLKDLLKSKYKQVKINKEYLYAVGDIPVGVVAHLDTVAKREPEHFFHDQENDVIWSPDGISGFDDRAGVLVILRLIERGYRPSVIFTRGEEVGGVGAEKLVKKYKKPISDLKFIMEFDRMGRIDAVYYENDNKVFQRYIEDYGFELDYGSFSDIAIIGPAWNVSTVNLSVGYFSEHTPSEFLNLTYLNDTLDKADIILAEAASAPYFEHVENRVKRCCICHSIIYPNPYNLCPNCYNKYILADERR